MILCRVHARHKNGCKRQAQKMCWTKLVRGIWCLALLDDQSRHLMHNRPLQTRYDSVVDETILQSAPTSAFPYIGELVIYLRQVDRGMQVFTI